MAERFNLTAQIQLQAPTNTAQVVGQIRKQLQGVSVDVKVNANPRQIAEVNKELQNVNKAAGSSAKSVGALNTNLAAAARRFSVITVATGAFLGLARAIKNSTGEAIAFERELLKISQITGKSVSQLTGLVAEVTKLSRGLGASSSDLLSVSKTLAQAGFSAQRTKQALESLAQTTLAATFNNIEDTTEAAIAVLRQFSAEARRSGGEIKFLQSTLDAINSVSKNFAVEAGDLTTVIRRVGGVFSSAGGSVNELIALFTSVRSTTRESAETIATGLRTIFTRIQRTDTVDQLAALGIQLRDSQGQFVGAYEAVRRLSAGLSALDPRDFRFSEIVESLGGFRQVGKVIPLIQQFAVAQDALNVAQGSAGSVARDAATAQKGLGNQIAKVREDFQALIRQFADSSTFRAIAGGALELAKAFIKIASSLEDMLPLIATLVSMKIGQSLAPGLGALLGGRGLRGKNQGGKIHAFARGGHVPGTGNRDTVPAMLQPGEFVIKKSSAKKLGASTLEAMNNNRYAYGGGPVNGDLIGPASRSPELENKYDVQNAGITDNYSGEIKITTIDPSDKGRGYKAVEKEATDLHNLGKEKFQKALTLKNIKEISNEDKREEAAAKKARDAINKKGEIGGFIGKKLSPKFFTGSDPTGAINAIKGGVNERNVSKMLTDRTRGGGTVTKLDDEYGMDFKYKPKKKNSRALYIEAKTLKTRASRDKVIAKALLAKALNSKKDYKNQIENNVKLPNIEYIETPENLKGASGLATPKKKNAGGGISGSDTVPALLTPGEYVINKSSARNIGYANLNTMNQTGVKRFAAGGAVGAIQKFGEGGKSEPMSIHSLAGVRGPDQKIIAAVNDDYNQLSQILKATISHMQKSGASTAEVAAMEKQYATTRTIQKKTVEALIKEGRKAEISVSSLSTTRDTLAKVLKSSEKLAKKEVARQKKSGQSKLAQAMPTFAAGGRAVKKGLGRVGQAAAGMRGGAESAQQIAFMGTAAAATAIQMSGLSDTTKQAATETLAFAAGLVTAGTTAIQMLSGLANMAQVASVTNQAAAASEAAETSANVVAAGSETAETVANIASTESEAAEALMNVVSTATEGVEAVADSVEAVASTAAGGGLALLAAPLIAIAVIAATVVLALKYLSSKLAAEADALGKRREALLDRIGAGEGGSAETAKSDVTRELAFRAESKATSPLEFFAPTPTVGYSVDEDGKATADLTKTFAKNIGVLDLLTGGIGGVVRSLAIYASATDESVQLMHEEAVMRKSMIDAVNTSIDTFARLSASSKQFDDALEDLNQIQFTDTEEGKKDRIEQQTKIASDLDTSGLDKEYAQLQRVATLAGESLSSLSETGLEEEFGKGSAELIAFQIATRNVNKALESMQKKTQLAREVFNSALDMDMDNVGETGTFEDLINEGGQLATAFKLLKESIKDEANAKIAQAQADQRAAREQIKTGEGTFSIFTESGLSSKGEAQVDAGFAALEEAQKREVAAKERLAKQEKALEDSGAARVEVIRKANVADREAAEAANALAAQIKATTNFMKQLSAIEFNQAQYSQNLSNQATVVSGGRMDHSVGIQGLGEDPTMIADLDQFTSDMMSAIGDLPVSMQAEAKKQLATVVKTSKLFTEGKDNVLKAFPVGATSLDKDFDPENIIRAAGLDPDDMDKAELNDIMKKIREKAQDGISDAEFDEIFADQKQAGKTASEANAQINNVRNADLANYSQYVSEIAKVRDRDIEASLANVDAVNRVAEMMAEGRGQELSAADKESGRKTRASAQLVGIRDPDGERVQAGNIDQVLATRLKAEEDLDRVSQARQGGDLTKDERNQLIAQEERLADVVKRTTNELERLGDQSDKAADIMGDIEKERGKREVAKGMLQDFVFGGQEDRGQMNMALAGVQSAAATGTVQNQSEEQRKATLGMLDRLGDIEIGGRSAKDIKEKIIFDDAVKMGLDPKIAERIAKATSKEEKLINALDKLGNTIIDATKAQGTHYTPDYQPPDGSAKAITGVFPTSRQNAQAQVAQMSDEEVLNRARQEKISGFNQEMEDAATPSEKKNIRKRYSAFNKEQKSLRSDFLRGKGDFSEDERQKTMAEHRNRLEQDIKEDSVAESRDWQTEGEIGPIRKPSQKTPIHESKQNTLNWQDAHKDGNVPTNLHKVTVPKRRLQWQDATAPGFKGTMGQSQNEEGNRIPKIQQWKEHEAKRAQMTPAELEDDNKRQKKENATTMKSFMSRQQGVKNRQQMSVQGEAGFTGAGESGGMSIDPTALQGVLTEFNTNFATTLEAVVTPFSSMSESLRGLNDSFQNLTMTHKFQGDMSMAFNITNQEELVQAISKGITPKMQELILAHIESEKHTFTAGE